MSNAVIKPAAWLRSNPALQSAKNNVRRVPGSDGDSLHRLRWRPGTGAQRYTLALLACCGRTSRSGAASAAGERGARRERQDSGTQPGRCPQPGGGERAIVSPPRVGATHCPCVRSNRSSPIPEAAPGRRRGRLGFGLAPRRAGFLARRAGGVRRWGGARGWLRTRVQRLRSSFGALCVSGHSVGSTSLPVTGPERTRGSGLGELRLRGAAAPLPHLGRRKVKWKTVAELSPPPPSPVPQPWPTVGGSSLGRVGRKAGGLGCASPAFLSAASPGLHAAFLCFESASSAQRLFPAGPAGGGGVGHRAVGPPPI